MKLSKVISVTAGAAVLVPVGLGIAFAHPHPNHHFQCAAPEIDAGLTTCAVALLAAATLLFTEMFRGRNSLAASHE